MLPLLNLMIILAVVFVPTALLIRLAKFLISFAGNIVELSQPIKTFIELLIVNLLRIAGASLFLYFQGLPIQFILTVVGWLALIVIVGLLLTGVIGDVISNILFVNQFRIFPGMKIRIKSFDSTRPTIIVIKNLGLLSIEGVLKDDKTEIIPYWHLRQSGFQVIKGES
ncbi:MAG: hypothetical protein C0410_05575 [Anaerolinea sp.]|nr:hypothetical protein [Anaerolinea sp.]